MLRREFLSRMVGWGCQGGITFSAIGCGTLMHSERCGQLHTGDIDWRIAALDGLGLILFFVPGVVAFAVDFCTGAIYLPPEPEQAFPGYAPTPPEPLPAFSNQSPGAIPTIQSPSHSDSSPTGGQQLPASQDLGTTNLKRVLVVRNEVGPQRIEQVVTNHVGRPVSFNNSDTRISRLPCLDLFANQCRQHYTNRNFGFPVKTFFDGLRRA
jgi:hypothetical protein